MGKKVCLLVLLLCTLLVSACGMQQRQQAIQQVPVFGYVVNNKISTQPQPASQIQINVQNQSTPQPTPTAVPTTIVAVTPTIQANTNTLQGIPSTGSGVAPYGDPPALTDQERVLTQQLFALINSDRAAQGLYAFDWNETLAGGARLHSWNMVHCGFSHTCPDGKNQCTRIADEGFAGYKDCGENIGMASTYPSAWTGMRSVQEWMADEPPTGWHHIHLFSTTLKRIGLGVYVQGGTIWFTEDMVG